MFKIWSHAPDRKIEINQARVCQNSPAGWLCRGHQFLFVRAGGEIFDLWCEPKIWWDPFIEWKSSSFKSPKNIKDDKHVYYNEHKVAPNDGDQCKSLLSADCHFSYETLRSVGRRSARSFSDNCCRCCTRDARCLLSLLRDCVDWRRGVCEGGSQNCLDVWIRNRLSDMDVCCSHPLKIQIITICFFICHLDVG